MKYGSNSSPQNYFVVIMILFVVLIGIISYLIHNFSTQIKIEKQLLNNAIEDQINQLNQLKSKTNLTWDHSLNNFIKVKIRIKFLNRT